MMACNAAVPWRGTEERVGEPVGGHCSRIGDTELKGCLPGRKRVVPLVLMQVKDALLFMLSNKSAMRPPQPTLTPSAAIASQALV